MSRRDGGIGIAFGLSLLLHAGMLALLALASGGGPHRAPVEVYSIHIMEAPAAPQARALQIEAPESLTDLPPPAPLPVPAPRVSGLAPALSGPPPLLNPPGVPLPNSPAPAPARQGRAADQTRNAIPGLPPPASRVPAAPPVPASQGPAGRPAAVPPAAAPAPASPSSLEQLRSRVQNLNLKVESSPRAGAGSTAPQTNDTESLLSLRLYQNRVRERVKENYTFPGNFPRTLRTRVRVVVNRDGTKRSVMLLESSGDDRFDTLVCLDAVHKATLPPVPAKIAGDTLTLTLSCSP